MSIIGLFDIGKTALFASQAGISITSNNIANVNTPGFSRQEIILEIATPSGMGNGLMGRGVSIGGVRRHYDEFVQSQLLGQRQNQGRSRAMDGMWSQVEQVFNEAGGVGLAKPLADFMNAWHDVANAPGDRTARSVLLQKAGALVATAQSMERGVTSALKAASDGIADATRRVNDIAREIAGLNDRITQAESGTTERSAHDLRDRRDQLMNSLSDLVEFSSYEDASGAVTVTVGMRNLVAGTRANTLNAPLGSDGSRRLSLDGIDITGNVRKGLIGGLLAARDDIASGPLAGLRRLTAQVVQQVNSLHLTGFGLDASTGNNFFNPLTLATTDRSAGADITSAVVTNEAALTLDEYRIGFDSGGNYAVTNKQTGAVVTSGVYNAAGTTIALPGMTVDIAGAVTVADEFTVSPLTTAISGFGVAIADPDRIAASATLAGLPGDNVNALALARLADGAFAGLGNTGFSEYYHGMVSSVGAMKRAAADGAAFDENLLTELTARRESLSGVSLDEEAANLIRYQRSYEAGARMIQVADELLQTVLSL